MDLVVKNKLLDNLMEGLGELNEFPFEDLLDDWIRTAHRKINKIYGKDSLESEQFLDIQLKFKNTPKQIKRPNLLEDYESESVKDAILNLGIFIDSLRKDLIDIAEYDSSLIDNYNKNIERIFISHSSEDRKIVNALIDLLEKIGLKTEQIFCSSVPGYGIEFGEDFLLRIKNELNSKTLVLFILSDNFYESVFCLCEMGATWIKTNQHIPIVIPPFEFNKINGVIQNSQGFEINSPEKLSLFKTQIENIFSIDKRISIEKWERSRNNFLEGINLKD